MEGNYGKVMETNNKIKDKDQNGYIMNQSKIKWKANEQGKNMTTSR